MCCRLPGNPDQEHAGDAEPQAGHKGRSCPVAHGPLALHQDVVHAEADQRLERAITVPASARLAKSDGRSILASTIWDAIRMTRMPTFWPSSQPTPANTLPVSPVGESP